MNLDSLRLGIRYSDKVICDLVHHNEANVYVSQV